MYSLNTKFSRVLGAWNLMIHNGSLIDDLIFFLIFFWIKIILSLKIFFLQINLTLGWRGCLGWGNIFHSDRSFLYIYPGQLRDSPKTITTLVTSTEFHALPRMYLSNFKFIRAKCLQRNKHKSAESKCSQAKICSYPHFQYVGDIVWMSSGALQRNL